MSISTGPITEQDIIEKRDLIGLAPHKFGEWVDYVEGLERELEFSKFDAERQKELLDLLSDLLVNVSRVHTRTLEYLSGHVTEEPPQLAEWRSYLLESLAILDQRVELGEIESEQVDALKEKLSPVLNRLGVRRYEGSAAESA